MSLTLSPAAPGHPTHVEMLVSRYLLTFNIISLLPYYLYPTPVCLSNVSPNLNPSLPQSGQGLISLCLSTQKFQHLLNQSINNFLKVKTKTRSCVWPCPLLGFWASIGWWEMGASQRIWLGGQISSWWQKGKSHLWVLDSISQFMMLQIGNTETTLHIGRRVPWEKVAAGKVVAASFAWSVLPTLCTPCQLRQELFMW